MPLSCSRPGYSHRSCMCSGLSTRQDERDMWVVLHAVLSRAFTTLQTICLQDSFLEMRLLTMSFPKRAMLGISVSRPPLPHTEQLKNGNFMPLVRYHHLCDILTQPQGGTDWPIDLANICAKDAVAWNNIPNHVQDVTTACRLVLQWNSFLRSPHT